MRFATYRTAYRAAVGLVDGSKITRIAEVGSMLELIDRWPEVTPRGKASDLEEEMLLAPLSPPRNFICAGGNYHSHVREGLEKVGIELAEDRPVPPLFTKATTAANAPYGDVPLHPVTKMLDWEVELAVVIGKRGHDIAEADVPAHVFGYCVANDVSARDLQRDHGGQWFKGKSLDGTCPFGPWIVTADEIDEVQDLELICKVNGKVKQKGSTREQIFPVARLIAEISKGMTLIPGDVILTGTPEGVGFARQPPEFLADGDLLESEIPGIGVLRNRIRAV